jgi:AcrR family transcriptional regulator
MNQKDVAKDRILAVARELFARKGYDRVSVREITSRARANLGAITYHFGSKEALYHAAIASIAEPLVAAIGTAAQSGGAAPERIETIVRAFLGHMGDNPLVPLILLRELASDRPLPPPMANAMRQNLGNIVRTVAAGQRDGTIRSGDPVMLALSVVAQLFFFRVAGRAIQEASGMDRNDPAFRAKIDEHVVATVRRTLAPDATAPA